MKLLIEIVSNLYIILYYIYIYIFRAVKSSNNSLYLQMCVHCVYSYVYVNTHTYMYLKIYVICNIYIIYIYTHTQSLLYQALQA